MDHRKKMVAPIIITVVFLLYLIGYIAALAAASKLSLIMIPVAIPLIALGVGMVYTLKSRIKEIRRGDEDDLSDY